jgi:hypothetical protein
VAALGFGVLAVLPRERHRCLTLFFPLFIFSDSAEKRKENFQDCVHPVAPYYMQTKTID